MSAFLYSIGILVAVVGLLTIGFSIPIRDFSLGNSLIGAGATAIVGGLVLIGLGAVARELRRLARALERPSQPTAGQPMPQPAQRGADAGRALGRMPLPTPTPPVAAAGQGRAEPHLGAPEPAAGAPRQRSDLFAAIRGGGREPPVPETENVPLSPSLPPRPAMPPRPEAVEEPAAPRAPEPRPVSPAALASRTASRLETPRAPEPRAPEPRRPSGDRAAERRSRNLFDTVWPTEPRRPEPEPAPEEAAEPEAPHDEHEAAPLQGEPRPVSILKSGVIDGMAYTLYTDGSIEAQLPKGLMRFASIDDLRNYLESNHS
ncbi:MAG TPA: hypothetical protein VNR11_20015 [Xanthobacteraceae bacterium]|nr:hypothetical protein [Xanthobacteraceae bacterium]